MSNKYIVKRRGLSLVVIEMMIVALGIAIWLYKKYHWDWIAGVLVFFGSIMVLGGLFFWVRIFRYIISILFSLFWAVLAYFLLKKMTDSTTTPWIAAGVIFIICLVLHKDYFVFERDAERIEYEER